jgi:hypothetical protein
VEIDAMVGAFADLSGKVDKISTQIGERRPNFRPVGGAINTTVGGTYLIRSAQLVVPAGRIWNVLDVGVFGGTDAHTAVPSVIVDVYTGTSPGEVLATPHLTDVLVANLAVPSKTLFSKEVEWVMPGEEIYAIAYSAPANTNLIFVANIADFHLEAKAAMGV